MARTDTDEIPKRRRSWLNDWWKAFGRLLDWPRFQQARAFDQNVVIRLFTHAQRDENGQWLAFPSLERLAGEYEHRQRVAEALKRTDEAGITSVIRKGGGRGNTTVRAIHVPAETVAQTGQYQGAKQVRQADSTERETVRCGAPNCPVSTAKQGRTPDANGINGFERLASEHQNELLRTLDGAGITDPKRSEFASIPWLTTSIISAAVEYCRTKGKSNGILVCEIRDRAAAAKPTTPGDICDLVRAGRISKAKVNGDIIDLTGAMNYSPRGLKRNGEIILTAEQCREAVLS